MTVKVLQKAVVATLICAFMTGGWIYCARVLGTPSASHPDLQLRYSIVLGLALGLVTGGLLYLIFFNPGRKQAKQKLIESEEHYRQLFELESDAVILVDCATHRFVDVNQSAQRLYGYSREQFLQMSIEEVSAEPESTRANIGSGQSFIPLRWHRKRDGSKFAVEISTNLIAHQGRRTELATLRDITQRQQVMKMLQETTEQLLEAQRIAGLGSYVFDLAAGTWTGSEVLGEILGLDEPGGQHDIKDWVQVVHPEDRESMVRFWQENVIKQHQCFDRIYRILRLNDHKERWVHGQGKLVRDDQGRPARVVGVIQDITEQRKLEQRMFQAQKLEAIGTLAGGIAHDFNNILGAMFGYADLLKQDTEGNAPAQENVEELLKATERAKDLVQQILTFSRQHEQKSQIIRLDTIVREAIRFLRASLPAQIKIQLAAEADVPPVLADPTQIYQVTINLVTNALHAMEGGAGQMTVTLDKFVPDQRFLQLHPDLQPGSYARLSVADTGHGMDALTKSRIFEPFFTTKPIGKGTGLGLSVVHGIVKAHGGAITVQSQVGRGSTFLVYFPGQPSPIVPPMPIEVEVPTGSGESILLLDDEPALMSAAQRLLTRLNYRVMACSNAREALRLCQRNPGGIDLVITDLTMPELNGLEVARELRKLRPDLPVILASGFSAELTEELLAEAGICELLEKPVSREALAKAVGRALAGANGSAAGPWTAGKLLTNNQN
jgi:PAS domain S-box-containing protein